MTRPTSRTALFAFILLNVTICETRRSPYFWRTYSSTSPRRSLQKSTSMSGGETRSGFRNRSKMSPILQRIDVRDSKNISRQRTGGRTAAGPDRNPALFREMDEVPDDQKVTDEPGLLEHAQFVIEPLDQFRVGFRAVAKAIAQTLVTKLAQIRLARFAFRHRVFGIFRNAKLQGQD